MPLWSLIGRPWNAVGRLERGETNRVRGGGFAESALRLGSEEISVYVQYGYALDRCGFSDDNAGSYL